MSKLNANAFSFVPGQAFKVPPAPAPAPVDRTTPLEAPTPAPTISLNIGGSKPTPPATPPPVPKPQSQPARIPPTRVQTPPVSQAPSATQSTAKSTASTSSSSPAPAPSTTFSLGRAKTDTNSITQEVHAVADESTLKDLFGNGALIYILLFRNSSHMLRSQLVKEHLNIVFVGHVDAGKSTMGGNILFLSGMVDKRTMEKYEREAKEAGRESWYLSWALDSTPQERAKGKTVEVGRAYFETASRRYTILDAPGHKTYVPSMISGAAQADVAILVISARKGEFETGFERGGQTREHIMLVKTAGVGKVVCVINKMDDTTVQWQKSRYEEIKEKMGPFFRAAGFSPKTDVTFMPVSAYTGANLKDRVAKSVCPWWE